MKMGGADLGRLGAAVAALAMALPEAAFGADESVQFEATPIGPELAGTPEPMRHKIFALIIGVNRARGSELPPLQYADDDAARYYDLFDALGARTFLLTRLDENTQRLHPSANEAAYPPTSETLRIVTAQMALDITQARGNGDSPVAYVIYAGHGIRHGGHTHLTLEGSDLPGSVLYREVLEKLGADQTHLIVDACNAELLAAGRGPGGERFPVEGFTEQSGLDRTPNVGLLIATSGSAESHEWDAVQAGIFSHEVRSGLYGAADLNGDRGVSYREIAAFIERSNAAIPNERFRPRVLARPPIGTHMLLEPSVAAEPASLALEIDGAAHYGHHILEDARGVRLLEFNNAKNVSLRLRRLPDELDMFLRRAGSSSEYRIPAGEPLISLADLAELNARATSRGAKHESFELLFEHSLAPEHVAAVRLTPPPPFRGPGFPYRRVAQWSGAAGALGLLITGAVNTALAIETRDSTPLSAPQELAAERARKVDRYNSQAAAFYAGGAALTALTTWLFFSEE
jgi:hypothetical protein